MCYCLSFIQLIVVLNLPVLVMMPQVIFFLETKPSYTIGHIKSMIQEKKGIPSDEVKLEFAGRLLEGGRTLNDYSIRDGSSLILNYSTGEVAVSACVSEPCIYGGCLCRQVQLGSGNFHKCPLTQRS